MNDHHPQRPPLLTRLVSLEGGFAVFGLFSLATGLLQGAVMPVFWGVAILAGLAILLAVRRHDWKQHWEDRESQRPKAPSAKNPDPPST